MSHRSVMLAVKMGSKISPWGCSTVRRATNEDVEAIATLINRAYQVEEFFVDGDRTSVDQVRAACRRGFFLVLDASGDDPACQGDGTLAGSIYVQIQHQRGYFGLLSVAPELHGHGVGARLIGVAEALCQAEGCLTMDLQVVNLRTELPPWYRSLGYEDNGTAPFPDEPALKQPCHFIRMTKELSF